MKYMETLPVTNGAIFTFPSRPQPVEFLIELKKPSTFDVRPSTTIATRNTPCEHPIEILTYEENTEEND